MTRAPTASFVHSRSTFLPCLRCDFAAGDVGKVRKMSSISPLQAHAQVEWQQSTTMLIYMVEAVWKV